MGVTGKRVGRTKERERRNELAMTSNEGDNGNGRDWLKCDHAIEVTYIITAQDLTHYKP